MTPSGRSVVETLNYLISRLEKASGADRRLDFDIWFLATPEGKRESEWPAEKLKMPWDVWFENWKDDLRAFPNYTASIDAALTLVPEGMFWGISKGTDDIGLPRDQSRENFSAGCWDEPTSFNDRVWAKTSAIALCIAALRARAIEQADSLSRKEG